MSELTDDQLDGLFRKSAEEFDPPFDPAAWQDMKSCLDNHDRTQPGGLTNWRNIVRWGLPVLFLLLLTGGAWYLYPKTSTVSRLTTGSRNATWPLTKEKRADNRAQSESARLAATGSHASPTGTSNLPKGDAVERRREAEPPASRAGAVADRGESKRYPNGAVNEDARPVTLPAERATERASASYRSTNEKRMPTRTVRINGPSVAGKAGKAASHLRKSMGLTKGVSTAKERRTRQAVLTFSAPDYAITAASSFINRPLSRSRQADAQAALIPTDEVSATESPANGSKPVVELNELAIRPAHWPPPLAFVGRPVTAAADTASRKAVASPKVPRGLSLRFAAAPDLSTVGLKNFSRPGTNIGLLLEYRLAARWSVQAGVVRSTKVYGATAGQYGYWPDYIKKWPATPTGVEGACTIIDIPINVRYDVLVKPRPDHKLPSRWFISTGVTSYVMKREDYTFTYSDYTHVYSNMYGESASTGGYGLSHLNLSVGYERALNRRLSWQVEPFMKMPLKGVGYFKIDLISTGTFFSIRYKL